jgi:hypothetical protein
MTTVGEAVLGSVWRATQRSLPRTMAMKRT